jgi:hypothetical protein
MLTVEQKPLGGFVGLSAASVVAVVLVIFHPAVEDTEFFMKARIEVGSPELHISY